MEITITIPDEEIKQYVRFTAGNTFTTTSRGNKLKELVEETVREEAARQIRTLDVSEVVMKAVDAEVHRCAERVVEGQLKGLLKSALYKEILRKKVEIQMEVAHRLSGADEEDDGGK